MSNVKKDLRANESDASLEVADAPLSDVRLPSSVTPEELRVFLGRRTTQERIRQIVAARVDNKTPTDVIEEIAQEASVAVLTSKSRPRSMATAYGWVGMVTARAVAGYFRREAPHRRWLNRDAEVEEQPGEPGEAPADRWLIGAWLAPILAQNPRDQETYELIVYKARTEKSHAEVAADHGMTTVALKSRIHEFKKKYQPRWRRRQSLFALLILGGAGAVLLVAWLLWWLTTPAPEIRPDTWRPAPRAPSATVSASDTPFEPALPTTAPAPRGPEKPPLR